MCRPTLPRAVTLRACATATEDVAVDEVDRVREWIQEIVIRLGLCPYAAKPYTAEQIRYVVSAAVTDEELIHDFYAEACTLLEAEEEEIATSFLIAPHYNSGIDDYYYLYEWLVGTLEEAGDEAAAAADEAATNSVELHVGDRIQPAFFHPQWSFSELSADAPLHFEKRAPYPVINLLRRAQLDAVVKEAYETRGVFINREISEHNAAALEAEGYDNLARVFARWLS